MRFVQTVWIACHSLLKNSFGWESPKTDLMFWALSSQGLREHTGELVLYTDSESARVLVDTSETGITA